MKAFPSFTFFQSFNPRHIFRRWASYRLIQLSGHVCFSDVRRRSRFGRQLERAHRDRPHLQLHFRRTQPDHLGRNQDPHLPRTPEVSAGEDALVPELDVPNQSMVLHNSQKCCCCYLVLDFKQHFCLVFWACSAWTKVEYPLVLQMFPLIDWPSDDSFEI